MVEGHLKGYLVTEMWGDWGLTQSTGHWKEKLKSVLREIRKIKTGYCVCEVQATVEKE